MYFEFWLLGYFELLSLREKKIPPPVGRCCYSLTSNQSLENRIILASNLHRLIITCCHHMIISLLTFKWHKHCKGGGLKKIFSNSILYRNAVVVKLVGDFTTQQGTLNFSPMQHKLIAHQLQIVKVIQPRERLYYQLQYYQVQCNAMQCNATLPGAMPASSTLPVSSLLLLPLLEFLLKIT